MSPTFRWLLCVVIVTCVRDMAHAVPCRGDMCDDYEDYYYGLEEPTTIAAEPTTIVAEPTTIAAEPTTIAAEPTTIAAEPTTIAAEPTKLGAEPTTIVAESPTIAAKPTTAAEEPTTIATEPTTVAAELTTNIVEPTTVAEEPTTIAAEATTIAAIPTTIAVEPTTIAIEPTTIAADPTTIAAKPTTIAAEPATIAAEPTTIAVEQTKIAAEPTTIAEEPTTFVAEPTTFAADPTTIAADPTTIATELTTVAEDPTTIAVEPETIPAERVTIVVEPTTIVPEPTTVAAEPTTVAAEPTTVAAEPTTIAAEPTTIAAPPLSHNIGGVQITEPATGDYHEGDYINIRCINPAGGDIEWVAANPLLGDIIIEDNPPFVINKSNRDGETLSYLSIEGAMPEDATTYTCRSVANVSNKAEITLTLIPPAPVEEPTTDAAEPTTVAAEPTTIAAPPLSHNIDAVQITEPTTGDYHEGDYINIRCINPAGGDIEWVAANPSLGDIIIEDNPPYVINTSERDGETLSYLSIEGAMPEDAITYTCRSMANVSNKAEITLTLIPPALVEEAYSVSGNMSLDGSTSTSDIMTTRSVVTSLDHVSSLDDISSSEASHITEPIEVYSVSGNMSLEGSTSTSDIMTTRSVVTSSDHVSPLDDISSSEASHITDISSSEASHITEPFDPCAVIMCHNGATCHEGSCICPPPSHCQHVQRPVCASDGKTYMSQCDMVAHMCVTNVTLVVVKKGSCPTDTPKEDECTGVVCEFGAFCDAGICRCPEVCPDRFSPVCGTNWQTYSSTCHLEIANCINRTDIRVIYKTSCDKLPLLKEGVIGASKDSDIIGDTSLIVIYACVGAVILIALIIIIIVLTTRRFKQRQSYSRHAPINGDATPLTSSPLKSALRSSSTSSQHHRVTIEPRPQQKQGYDKLSGRTGSDSSKNHYDVIGANGKAKNGVNGCGIPIRRLLSSTDTSVVEMSPEDDVTVEITSSGSDVKPVQQPSQGRTRSKPGRRHASTTENSVYEVTPDEGATIDMDDVFANDQMITRL